jgi:hypothetical protein
MPGRTRAAVSPSRLRLGHLRGKKILMGLSELALKPYSISLKSRSGSVLGVLTGTLLP